MNKMTQHIIDEIYELDNDDFWIIYNFVCNNHKDRFWKSNREVT